MKLAAFQAIIYLVTATANSSMTFLACAFILNCKNNTNVTSCNLLRSIPTDELTTLHSRAKQFARKIGESFRAGSNQMLAVDKKQKLHLEWP